jgi:ribosomal protein S18 acetylase RimI-like enzyme
VSDQQPGGGDEPVESDHPDTAHLAQFNIARLRHPIGHPDTAGFEALIDETNARAEASPGFVWRHGIDSRDTDVTAYDDPLVLVNASVWESIGHLRDYVYRGFHRDVYRRRSEWFDGSAAVMWWIPAGTIPTLAECKARLAFHDEFGSSPYAFGTGERHPQLVMRRHTLDDPVVAPMLERLNAELRAAIPEGGTNFVSLPAEHVADDQGAFVVAWLDGRPAACGAWRRIDEVAARPHTAEIKRMWADPTVRGQRLGAAVLATLQTSAQAHGITELRLETGEYLTAAVGLYRRFGFAPCASWGEYVGAPHSYTMAKALSRPG